jgi:hypothetical protein
VRAGRGHARQPELSALFKSARAGACAGMSEPAPAKSCRRRRCRRGSAAGAGAGGGLRWFSGLGRGQDLGLRPRLRRCGPDSAGPGAGSGIRSDSSRSRSLSGGTGALRCPCYARWQAVRPRVGGVRRPISWPISGADTVPVRRDGGRNQSPAGAVRHGCQWATGRGSRAFHTRP